MGSRNRSGEARRIAKKSGRDAGEVLAEMKGRPVAAVLAGMKAGPRVNKPETPKASVQPPSFRPIKPKHNSKMSMREFFGSIESAGIGIIDVPAPDEDHLQFGFDGIGWEGVTVTRNAASGAFRVSAPYGHVIWEHEAAVQFGDNLRAANTHLRKRRGFKF